MSGNGTVVGADEIEADNNKERERMGSGSSKSIVHSGGGFIRPSSETSTCR